jgi:uncharacterized protein YuzE
MKYVLFVLIAVVLGLCACSSIDCPVQNTVRTLYVLKKSNQKGDTLKDTLNVVTFTLNRKDTTLLAGAIGKTSFSLPVSYANPEDTLYFLFRNGTYRVTDTVWVKKENYPHFESVDCNAAFFHKITAIRSSHYAIDSICIKNPSVTYDPTTEHFYIYIKARR